MIEPTGSSSLSHDRGTEPSRPVSGDSSYHTSGNDDIDDSEDQGYVASTKSGSSFYSGDLSQARSDEDTQFNNIMRTMSTSNIIAPSADTPTHFTIPPAQHRQHPHPPLDSLPSNDDTPCLHPIHPAYANTYLSDHCPACQLNKLLDLARIPALTIISRGGHGLWKQTFTLGKSGDANTAESHHFFTTVGQHKRRTPTGRDWHVDEHGNVSFPRAKTNLLNYIQRLEALAEVEWAWEVRNPVDGRGEEMVKRCEAAWVYSAASALARWHGSAKSGLQKVEEISRKWARKRGRELEIASRPEFPEPDDMYTVNRVLSLTKEQQDFINANLSSESDTAADGEDEGPPKRKRRRLSATVDFDKHTYVRSEADIDVLFAPSGALTADFLEDVHTHTPVPLRSVLRTTPQHMHPPPEHPHEVRALKMNETYTARRVRKHGGRSREGYDRVDTSGLKKKGELWDKYRMALAAEAGQEIEAGNEDKQKARQDESVGVEGVVQGEVAAGQAIGEAATQESGLEVDVIDEDDVPVKSGVAEVEKQIEQAQGAQQVQQAPSEPPEARFRPHGGMASALALGSFVRGAAVELAQRAGLW